MKNPFKKKHKPMDMETAIASLEKALLSGHALHTFRSGGGLQVVRIEKVDGNARRGELKGYGEHPHINEALRHAGEDFATGGRPYAEVYGTCDWDNPENSKEGIYPMYLTGTHDVVGKLDQWVKQNTVDARGRDGQIEVELRGWAHQALPDSVQDRCTRGRETIEWESERGCKFKTSPFTFPGNGEPGCSTQTLSMPEGMRPHRAWDWRTKQIGRGATFADALNAAFAAKPEEINDEDD